MADRRELCVGGKPISSLRVVDLKVELEKRSLPKSGSKKELLERLRLHLQLEETREAALKDEDHVPNLSLCNETENDFVREYLAAQQARFQVQKEAKKQYEEKVRESEASAEETTQDEDEPSDYSPVRKSSPRKSSRSKRKEELTSTPVANKEASQFQTPESLATPREEETPSQDDDTTEEEEARTPRTRKHKLLKYVQTPKGSERKQPGNSVTGQGQVEQLHAGRRDPPPSQLYGDAGVASSTDAKGSHTSALPGSSSKASSSAESSESESVFPRLVDVWSEKDKESKDQTSRPDSPPKKGEKPPAVETIEKSPKKSEEPKEINPVSEAKLVKAAELKTQQVEEATKEETLPEKSAEEPAPIVPSGESAPIVSSEEPASIVPSEEPASIVPSEEPASIVPSEEPASIVPSKEPAPIVPSEEPASIVPSEESAPIVSSEDAAPIVPSEEPAAIVASVDPAPIAPSEELVSIVPSEEPPTIVTPEEPATIVSPEEKEHAKSPVRENEEAKEDTSNPNTENTGELKEAVSHEPEKKEEDVIEAKEVIDTTPSEIVASNNTEEIVEKAPEDSADKNRVEPAEKQEKLNSEQPADDAKDFKDDEKHAEANKPSAEEKTAKLAPVEDVLTIEAEPEPLEQPVSSESKEVAPENKNEESVEVKASMAIEEERTPPPKARPESRQEDKTEPLEESAQQASDNEEDEIQVDASELIDDSLKITEGDEAEVEKREQARSHSRYSSTSRSESRNSDEERNLVREKEQTPQKTEPKMESPHKSEPTKLEPARKLKIKKLQSQSEVEPAETSESSGFRKRKWGTSNLLPNKKPALVISTDSLKTIVPDAKPLSLEEVRLGSPNFQSAKLTTAHPADEEEEHTSKPEKPEIVRRVAVEVAEVIAPAKPDAVIAAAAPLLEATSPAQQPRSCVLEVMNLVRPFTINQLRDLLARTGHLVDGKFWIDKVKSMCLVQYETEEEAEETRAALHGIHWPTSNPKTLTVDFSTVEKLEFRMANKDVPISALFKVKPAAHEPAPTPAPVDEGKRERPEKVREWDLGKVSEADVDKSKFSKENRPAADDYVEVKAKDDVPAKLLDDLFRKTKATPCIYWLPLTDAQIAEKEDMRRQRIAEREKHEREVKQRKDEEFQERQREREKQRENERERQRARDKEREKERQRSRKRSHSSSSSSRSRSSSPGPAKRRSSKTPPRRR